MRALSWWNRSPAEWIMELSLPTPSDAAQTNTPTWSIPGRPDRHPACRAVLSTNPENLSTRGPKSWAFTRFAPPRLSGILGIKLSSAAEETTMMYPPNAQALGQARIADFHRQAQRAVTDERRVALFASGLQRSDAPSTAMATEAITATVRRIGIHACVSRMAQEFGDHPDAAAERMRWICQLAAEVPAC